MDTSKQLEPRTWLAHRAETRMKRPIKIEDSENDSTLSRCNMQYQSPLFSLPREMRDVIWEYASAPYEVTDKAFELKEFYCRPGHTAPFRTDFALLLTCRRIWLEANEFPMLQAEHCFWYYRAAPDGRDKEWMASLTAANRRNFGTLHLFPQMVAIENLSREADELRMFFTTPQDKAAFQPRVMHVTVRHTDWWSWEFEHPLRFRDSWLQALLDTEDLRSTHILKLDLETLEYKVPQLLSIVERLKLLESEEFATHLVDGKPTATKFVLQGEPTVTKWSGPTNINGIVQPQYRKLNALNYHIITLTWRLHFPEHPHAHVTTLRLAPRVPSQSPPVIHFPSGLPRFGYDSAVDDDDELGSEWSETPDNVCSAGSQCLDQITEDTKAQADRHEEQRRSHFEWKLAPMWRREYLARWQAEGSLLSLADG